MAGARKPTAKATKGGVAKPAARKKPPANRKRVTREPVIYDGFLETLDRRDDKKHLTVFEQARLGQALLVERTQPKPAPWSTLARRYGVSESRLRRLYAKVQAQAEMHNNLTGLPVLEETLSILEGSIEELARVAATTENDNAKVGALRLMLETVERRVTLLSGMGRMPRSFRAMDELTSLSRLIRTFVEKLERHDIPPEVVEEFMVMLADAQPVVEHRPLALRA